jgi:Histidine kinase
MKDTQILSTFPESAPGSAPALPAPALVFDACRIGVVLRAVLFVELAIAAVVMFDSHGLLDWLARLSLVTGAALPAVLVWLLLACLAKRVLARLRPSLQYLCAGLLGAGAALYGCGVLALSGLALEPPWLASALSGMLLSAVLVAALVLRAKGRTPANTAARLTELQARIRPHFLFNTLNRANRSRWPMRLRWRGATWPSNKFALANACKCSGVWTPMPTAPACRPCSCSHWSKTPCAMVWSPAPVVPSCIFRPSGAAPWW